MEWLAKLRPRKAVPDQARLGLESEAQALRLELAERDQVIGRLEAELRRARDTTTDPVERLFTTTATPLVQLATQVQLEGVDAASLQAVARSLLRDLEDEGMELIGQVGAVEPYDLTRYEPLSDVVFSDGQPVVVRIVGLSYRGLVLRRAGVEAAP